MVRIELRGVAPRVLVNALAVLGLMAGARPAVAQTGCGGGVGVVSGQVVDSQGRGVPGGVVRVGDNCGALTDSTGHFRLAGFSHDSVLVESIIPGYCIVPTNLPTRGEVAQSAVLVAVPEGPTEAFLRIHGNPYFPPTYDLWRCRDRISRGVHQTAEAARGLELPSPEQLLAWVLQNDAVVRLMRDAAALQDTVPLFFYYGDLGGAHPGAPTPYALTANPTEGMYVVVLSASSARIEVQVARQDLSGPGGAPSGAEFGLRVEWRRTASGWDSGSVVDSWSPTR